MTNQIKNDPASYKRLGGDWIWTQSTVMHKKTGGVRQVPRHDYVYHQDPEINALAKEFVDANHGREAWQVNGEMYADFLYKFRRLEEATGILVNEPKKDDLEKSTILKEAYKKYKFVEKMVLGK